MTFDDAEQESAANRRSISRRHLLRAGMVGGVLTLAGCSGSDNGGGETDQGTTSAQEATSQGTTSAQEATSQGTTSAQEATSQGTTSAQEATSQGTANTQGGVSGTTRTQGGGTQGGSSNASERPAWQQTSGQGTPSNANPATDTLIEPTTSSPSNWQFNHLNLTNPFSHAMQSDQLQRYHINTGGYTPYAISIKEFNDKTAVLQVRDGLTWHNGDPGDPVDADDLYTKLVTDDIIGDTLSTLWTDIQRDGDRSVRLSLDGTVNKELFKDGLNYYWLETPYRMYKEYVERWEDASTTGGTTRSTQSTEAASIRTDLRNDSFDQPKGNGPFQFEERDNNHLRMSLYEHHPDAHNINWDYWNIKRVSTDTASVLLGMKIDAIRNYTAPNSVLNNKPKNLMSANLPALWGNSLPFNHENKDFSNIRVRQAICEFVSRKDCAHNYGQFGQPVEAPSGLVGNINGQNEKSDRWKDKVSEKGAKRLHRYQSPERGRRLLKEEGYKKDGGKWYRPNGDRFKVPVKSIAGNDDWLPVYKTVVSNLNQEGIKSELLTFDASTYWADHYLAGNFTAATTGWTLQRSSPYYVFDMYYNIDSEFMNFTPDDLKVPPMGKPDGELQSVDPRGLMDELLVAQDETRMTELTDKLAWITNQAVPMLPITEINDTVWFTTDDWDVPSPDSPKYQSKWPLWWFPRSGELKAKSA